MERLGIGRLFRPSLMTVEELVAASFELMGDAAVQARVDALRERVLAFDAREEARQRIEAATVASVAD